jgi:WD40 repeat protein
MADPFVFVSYSRADSEYVEGLVAYLGEEGIFAWIDREQIINGDRWAALIEQQIAACAAMVLVMSPAAASSEWVEREIALAQARQKPILPLLLAGEPLFRVLNLHYDDVRDGRIPPPGFLQRLRTLTGAPPVAPTFQAGLAQPRRLSGPRRSTEPRPTEMVFRRQLFEQSSEPPLVAIAPSGEWLATAGGDRHVRLWDAKTGELLGLQPQHPDPIDDLLISPDGEFLITKTFQTVYWWDSADVFAKPLRTWAIPTRAEAAAWPFRMTKAPRVALSPQGTWLAVMRDRRIYRVDAQPDRDSVRALADLAMPDGSDPTRRPSPAGPMVIAPDDNCLAIGGGPAGISVISSEHDGGTVPWSPPPIGDRFNGPPTAIAWAPTGAWLITAAVRDLPQSTPSVSLWSAPDGRPLGHFGVPQESSWALAIARSADWFLAATSSSLAIWRPATREQLVRLTVKDRATCLSLSPDATWFVAGARTGAYIYDIRYGDPL